MKKKLLVVLLTIIMITLTGCQLAQEDAGEVDAVPDRLAGVFITTEHLNLFDVEGYLQDNWNGEDEVIVEGGSEYQGRIYAERVTKRSPDGYEYVDYEFSELEGILLAEFLIIPEGGTEEESYWTGGYGEGLNNICSYLHTTDEGTEVGVEATLYLSDKSGDVEFYYNPVYQTEEGEVYLMEGTGTNFGPELGGTMTHTLSETRSITENGVITKETGFVKVIMETVQVAERVVLIQMDENHQELTRCEAVPGGMPEELTAEADCAYILVEQIQSDGTVLRSVCQEDIIQVYYDRGDGICIPDQTLVVWAE